VSVAIAGETASPVLTAVRGTGRFNASGAWARAGTRSAATAANQHVRK